MPSTVSYFKDLTTKYSTWQELRTFLESSEGGSLRCTEPDVQKGVALIRYVKGQSSLQDADKPWVPWFRSVVWNTNSNRPVCIAPRKAMSTEIPTNQAFTVEEFLEGVMVNAFVREAGTIAERPELVWATRSTLGAETGFYTTKTFAQMIEEAQLANSWQKGDLASTLAAHGYTFASFVLQHPEHRVVQKIEKASLSIVHLGRVEQDGSVVLYETKAEWPEPLQALAIHQYAPLEQGETPAQRLESVAQTSDSLWQGLVFRGSNGERWRIRTLGYKIMREIRGKESRAEERFARLRMQNMIRLYLTNFPEDAKLFADLEQRTRDLTTKIYAEYCAHHKEKSKTFMDIPVALRTPVYELHGIYLTRLRAQKLTLKMPVVIHYVNNLSSEVLGALLRKTAAVA